MPVFPRLTTATTTFLQCDIQEVFRGKTVSYDSVITVAKRMGQAASLLAIKVIGTEQVPEKLGGTVGELDGLTHSMTGKSRFSMLSDTIQPKLASNVVLYGIEAHVCVLQTTRDLLEQGFHVCVLADGVSSRRLIDRNYALENMRQMGAQITTHEAVLFELMGDAEHRSFRDISKLVREPVPEIDAVKHV